MIECVKIECNRMHSPMQTVATACQVIYLGSVLIALKQMTHKPITIKNEGIIKLKKFKFSIIIAVISTSFLRHHLE